MKKFKYIFIGEEPVSFPTLGIEAKKDDVIESDEPLLNHNLKEVVEPTIENKKGE